MKVSIYIDHVRLENSKVYAIPDMDKSIFQAKTNFLSLCQVTCKAVAYESSYMPDLILVYYPPLISEYDVLSTSKF